MNAEPANIVPFGEPPQDRREPPSNIAAEQLLLGALLVENSILVDFRDVLSSEHFAYPIHGRIYTAICALIDKGTKANTVTVRAYFDNDRALADVGGGSYISRLEGSVANITGCRVYADAIVEMWRRRVYIGRLEEGLERAYDPEASDTTEAMLAPVVEFIDTLKGVGTKNTLTPMADALAEAEEASERALKAGGVVGVKTGLRELDAMIGGLQVGGMAVLAGRPSMGKSALGQFIATNAAEEGANVAFFSLEMTKGQIGQRHQAAKTGISLSRISAGEMGPKDRLRIADLRRSFETLPMYLDASRGLTVGQIRDKARQHARKVGKLDLIVVDYLQLVRGDGRRDNKTAEVAEISGAFKTLAGEMDVPVLVLAQLNRESEKRDNKRPTMAELRWAGDIEQDADVVMLLYRDGYYKPDADKEDLEIIVAKNRQGETGTVHVRYHLPTSSFGNVGAAPRRDQPDFDLGAPRASDSHPNAPGNA